MDDPMGMFAVGTWVACFCWVLYGWLDEWA